jgi:formamidopyrimidine-DNA glycosylase
MPELPEVETTRRDLAATVGRRIVAVEVYDRRLRWPVPRDLPAVLAGASIRRVGRRSKYLLFGLDRGTMIVHFGMTGSLTASRSPPPRRAHDHLDWRLDDGTTLRYHDPRRFGAVLWTADDPRAHPLLRDLGPEPLEPGFDGDHLWRAARGRRLPIKALLMDAHIVVGVGNIYASEALFRAGIRPTRAAATVSRARMATLAASIREVLDAAIASGGSTLRDYVSGRGEAGRFQFTHFVYGREGAPCRVCGTPIRARYVGQRNTFHCPSCQS